jgi:hypothetical protein
MKVGISISETSGCAVALRVGTTGLDAGRAWAVGAGAGGAMLDDPCPTDPPPATARFFSGN